MLKVKKNLTISQHMTDLYSRINRLERLLANSEVEYDPNLAQRININNSEDNKRYLDQNGDAYLRRIYFGDTSKDGLLYHDGTKGVIDVENNSTPADLHIITGAEKTEVLDTVVYDDQQINIGEIAANGWFGNEYCEVVQLGDGIALDFTNSTSSKYKIRFNAQITHRYKEGEDINFHFHVYNDNTASGKKARFKITYGWADVNNAFPTTGTNTIEQTFDIDTTSRSHKLFDFSTKLTGTSKTVSSILMCTLERDAGHTDDNYSGDIHVIGIDFHVPIDTQGSRNINSKY